MKNLKRRKRGKKIKCREKRKAVRTAFMSMGLPPNIVKGINRESRSVGFETTIKKAS